MKGHEPFGLQRQTPTHPAFLPHAPRIGGRTPGPWEQGHGSVVARPPPGCKLRAPGKARGWGASAPLRLLRPASASVSASLSRRWGGAERNAFSAPRLPAPVGEHGSLSYQTQGRGGSAG